MNRERRSYFAATVEAAMAEARMELGDDAFLVDTRRLAGEADTESGYEVLFEIDDPARSADRAVEDNPGTVQLVSDVAGLKKDLAVMAGLLKHLAAAAHGIHPELAPVAASLAEAGFPEELSSEILSGIERRLGYGPARNDRSTLAVHQALAAEIESRIKTMPGVGMAAAARKVVVLAGPPGAGKTTTLAKLAVTQGVSRGLSTAIVSTDAFRVGASGQLRSYSAILGLPFTSAETPGGLIRALEEHRNKRLVLIDTAGFGPRDFELAKEWARLFVSRGEIEVQLVLNATTRCRDLVTAAARWAEHSPSRLIFTRLDETSNYGGMLACAMKTQLPVSFTCAGQSVPEDIEEATASGLLNLVLGREKGFRAAAA